MRKILIIAVAFILSIFIYSCKTTNKSSSTIRGNEKIFKAGASVSNITDPSTLPSTSIVHDSLNARSLVLDDGITKLAFVVVDQRVVTREVFDEAKRLIM